MAINYLKIRKKIIFLFGQEQARLVLWAPVCLGLGISFYFSLGSEPPFWAGFFGLVLGFSAFRLSKNSNQPVLPTICMGAIIVALGFSAAQWRMVSVSAPVLPRAIGPTTVEGRLVHYEARANGSRITLEKPRISGLGPEFTPNRVRIALARSQPDLVVGNWVSLRAKLSPPPPPAAPGAYDFQRRFFFEGIGGLGFAFGKVRITSSAGGETHISPIDSLLVFFSGLRRQIGKRVQDSLLQKDEMAVGAVTRALMTGERGGIPEKVMEDFRDSGIAHLLAISGLHIGLVAGIVFVGFRGLLALLGSWALRYPIKKWAAIAAILSALAYAMIAGATVPTIRAFLMIGLVLTAVIFDRRGLSLRLIAFAASVILLIKPESLLGASFQLSFAAVTALVATYEALSEWKWVKPSKGRGIVARIFLYAGGVALTTLIAGTATAPFAAFHFNRFADYGLAANLLAVPLTGLWIMPWAVVSFALMPFRLEELALVPMGLGVSMVIDIAEEVAAWPGAVTLLPAMETWGIVAITFGGLWLCLWRYRLRLLGLFGIAAGLVSLIWVQTPDILIDAKGKLWALKDSKGQLTVSSLKTAKFTRETWLRRAAQENPMTWQEATKEENRFLACDQLGCIYSVNGRKIALIGDVGAIDEDCRMADIVISSVPVRIPCKEPAIVIDRFDLWRNGAYAFWLDESGWVRIKTVNGERGKRPWVLRPKRRSASNNASGV